jgi:glutamyl-Q tRNA(Asp) synthetase
MAYRGRFAPSPTGPLHAGSLVAALASWLDARAHDGTWLVRIEDVDAPRCIEGMGDHVMSQLAAFGLVSNEVPLMQSQRATVYQQALQTLIANDHAYPCRCSRKDILTALEALGRERPRHAELVYPGTCRSKTEAFANSPNAPKPAWRFRTDNTYPLVHWHDRRLGNQQQDVETAVGDFPLKRADGCATYQLAVVVDDAVQGITHIVRGEDLADNTARQILLQRSLGFTTPRYLHTPLVLGVNGEKLSKQNGAQALETSNPLIELNKAAAALGLHPRVDAPVGVALAAWVQEWQRLYNPAHD